MSDFLNVTEKLARLFCQENIDVKFDNKAATASFAPTERIMTLPILKNGMERSVYNLFVAHESSHALHTPIDCFEIINQNNLHPMLVNIVEDVRIEKIIQNKFPGLRRDFRDGYNILNDMDFFAIKDIDISSLKFIDRLNLHFKLGSRALIPFTNDEQELVNLVDSCVTFDDVIEVCKQLKEQIPPNFPQNNDQSVSEDSEENEDTRQQSRGNEGVQNDENAEEDGGNKNNEQLPPDSSTNDGTSQDVNNEQQNNDSQTELNSEHDDRFDSDTQKSFDENMKQSVDTNQRKAVIIDIPRSSVFHNFLPIELIEQYYESSYENYYHSKYQQFKKTSRSEVNFLVQQFQMKKSADEYRRTGTSKTGVLDMNNLHQYKISDDIFLRNVTVPDGKNHGMVMLVDFSGSMQGTLKGVVKQVLILVNFCRKVGIPYEVLAFGCRPFIPLKRLREHQGLDPDFDLFPETQDEEILWDDLALIQLLSSSRSNYHCDKDEYHLFQYGLTHGYSNQLLQLGGTPLNLSLIGMIEFLPIFRKKNNLQKMSLIVLTDGDSHRLRYNTHRPFTYDTQPILRDWRTKKTYNMNHGNMCTENTISVRILRESVPDVDLINIFIGNGRHLVSRITSSYHDVGAGCGAPSYDTVKSSIKKNRSFYYSPKNNTYHGMMYIDERVFGEDTAIEMQVDEGASKTQIKSAFTKMLKARSTGYAVLSRFIATIS